MLFWLSIFSLQLLLSRFRNLDPCFKRHISLAVKNNLMESTAVIIGCDFRIQITCYKGGRAFLFFSFDFHLCSQYALLWVCLYSHEVEIFFGFYAWQVVPINFSGYCTNWVPKCVWKSRKLNQEMVLGTDWKEELKNS